MRKRFLGQHAGVVDQEFGRKIIRAIDDKIISAVAENLQHVGRRQTLLVSDDLHFRVHGRDLFFGGKHFGFGDIRSGVNDLALQIAQLDRVGIDQTDRPDPAAYQVQQAGDPNPPVPTINTLPSLNFLLAFQPDILE